MPELSHCIEFLRRIIQTESLPGREAEVADLVQHEMKRLGYDQVERDEAGNVIGLVRGQGLAPAIMFNTHLDHVDVGDPNAWPYPPFAAECHDDRIWGRGAMDIKGPLAAQLYAIAALIDRPTRPPGDIYVSAVVQEEVGGLGARHLVTHLQPPLVVIGEASSNQLRRGHRGRTELTVTVTGKSVHASVPHRGVNPLEVVARFILGLKELSLKTDPDLGSSSVAPTLIRTDQSSPNVVPAECQLTCDWRNIPGETAEEARQVLQELAESCLVEGATASVQIPTFKRVSFTGLYMDIPSDNPAYVLPADHLVVQSARRVLQNSLGASSHDELWSFATDAGHFAVAGLSVIGFGPGDETLAHTIHESIAVSEIETAIKGNQALALEWAAGVAAAG